MTSLNQKEKEKRFFEKLRLAYALPEGIITYGDKPDVIIEGSRKIGIEISDLYIKDGNDLYSEQSQCNLRKLVLQNAQVQYFASSDASIELTVSFDEKNPITDIKSLSKNLAKLLLNLDEISTGWISKKHFSHILEISSIFIYSEKTIDPQWRTVQVHTGKSLCINRINEIVKTKTEKLKKYEACDSYWLLLIVDFWDSAQDQDIRLNDDSFLEPIYSPFEKVIVYKPAENLYVELPVSPL